MKPRLTAFVSQDLLDHNICRAVFELCLRSTIVDTACNDAPELQSPLHLATSDNRRFSCSYVNLSDYGAGKPLNSDIEGGVQGAVGGIIIEPLRWHHLLTPKGWKRLTSEGHTFADAILTVAMAQIGMAVYLTPKGCADSQKATGQGTKRSF